MLQKVLFAAIAAFTLVISGVAPAVARSHDGLRPVQANDNRRPAGTTQDGSLVLQLRAALGGWRPEGEAGPTLHIEALGEESGPLQVPAPLIRVREGQEIVVSVQNDLDAILRVHGWCARDDSPCVPLEVPAGARREVSFQSGRAGTYHYWATSGVPQRFRAAGDTQLSGAFIVDPVGPTPADRVLVITEWTNLTRAQLFAVAAEDDPGAAFLALDPRFTFLINGLSWPNTERLTYSVGEQVRWRLINLSTQPHPMHLHGFYFDVESQGDGLRDTALSAGQRQKVVTRLMAPGATMVMSWRPERVGNWLFHCHISEHVSPLRRLSDTHTAHGVDHAAHDASAGMAGMILGITVVAADGGAGEAETPAPKAPRRLILTMRSGVGRYGDHPAYGFVLGDTSEASATDELSAPGPTLALRRGEPVEIVLVNQLGEATSIHWHGIELDSYYDGVHGWSGAGSRVAPMIEAGQTFTVRFTPLRAGTFIYHTHLDDRQLNSGMYGALVVLEPDEVFDPVVDHVVVIGRDGLGRDASVVLNGLRDAQLSWKAGTRHRVRYINITPGDIFVVSLGTADAPVEWRPLAKDGAPVPAELSGPRSATQTIAVGETYDFEVQTPPGRQGLWINVRTPAGRWQTQARVNVK